VTNHSSRRFDLALPPPPFAIASFGAEARPFKVLGLQQVALGGLSKGKLSKLWCDVFGLEKVRGCAHSNPRTPPNPPSPPLQVTTFSSAKENVDEDVLRLGAGPLAVEIDLMQPLDATKSPKVHEPPLNHIGLWGDDLPAAVKWLTAQGVRFAPGGIRRGASGFDVTFIHPKGNEASPLSGEGVLIELVQAPPAVIAAFKAAGASPS